MSNTDVLQELRSAQGPFSVPSTSRVVYGYATCWDVDGKQVVIIAPDAATAEGLGAYLTDGHRHHPEKTQLVAFTAASSVVAVPKRS